MKVALVALHFAEYASRIALALAARHEVLLVLRSDNAEIELSETLRAELRRAVILREIEVPKFRDPRFFGSIISLIRLVSGFRPDVVHFQENHAGQIGVPILALRRRVPVVLEVHDPTPHSDVNTTKDGWKWRVVRWVRRRVARVIAHGPQMHAEIEQLDRGLADRIDDVPIGIMGLSSVDEDVSGCEPNTFLFFGRMQSYKGLRYVLDAGDLLHARGRRFRLVVAGTGPDLERHRVRIGARAWVELIDRYIGPAEVPGLFRRALAVVLPYTDATQSSVTAMAFAVSRPVIATRVGGLPDVVIDGETGLLVPPRDAAALADSMERLLTHRRQRDALAAGAGRFAKERLSWPRIADLMHGVYARAVPARLGSTRSVGSQAAG